MVSSLTKFLHYEVFKVHCFVCQAFGLLFKAVGFCEPYVILLSSTFIVNNYFGYFHCFFQVLVNSSQGDIIYDVTPIVTH